MPFILGAGVVFLSTLFFALATTIWSLLAARVLEGLSTSIVMTVGYTLLAEAVGMEHLGKATGYTSLALTFGLLIGPVIGGVLYEYCGYFQVFLPAFGLIIMEAILRLMVIEKEKPNTLEPPSIASPPLLSPRKKHLRTTAAPTNGMDVPTPSIVMESDLLIHQEAVPWPASVYTILLSSPHFVVALAAQFTLNSIANGFDSTLTPYIQETFGMRATHAAALFLSCAVPMFLAPLSGWLTDRYGPRLPVVCGLVLAIPSLVLLSLVSEGTTMPFLKLALLLACVGLTFALSMGPLRVQATLVVDRMEKDNPGMFGSHGALGRATGLMNTVVSAATFLGPLGAGFVRVVAGWGFLELLNAGMCIATLLLFVLTNSGSKKKAHRTGEADA